ncbi:MAG: hypothetical protein HY673_07355 [Chloroflexi bacterium]|nr:hypothetical protein [Chloroflexota bacterium]
MSKLNKVPALIVLALAVALIGVIAACVPQDLTANVAATRTDVAAVKTDLAKLNEKLATLEKNLAEPTQMQRETKDQVIRGRADLLDYRMNYDNFTKSLLGSKAIPAKGTAKAVPAKTGAVTTELAKLQAALAGTPAKAATAKAKATPAKPGLLATKAQIDSLTKALDRIETRLTKIESALAAKTQPASATK